MDRGAWWATAHKFKKSPTWLSHWARMLLFLGTEILYIITLTFVRQWVEYLLRGLAEVRDFTCVCWFPFYLNCFLPGPVFFSGTLLSQVWVVKVKVTQSCPILFDPMDCIGIVHGILQARTLEWIAIPFSKDLPNSGIEPTSPTVQVDSLPAELLGKPKNSEVGSLSFLQWTAIRGAQEYWSV